jgi:hypothetical protein
MTEMRDKIARAIEDNLKSQGIRVVIDIAAQPDVRHICDGMLSLGALADAVLALIEPVMEENERLRTALAFDEPDAFERWWGSYKHKNRELADYTRKKCIAFDAFHEALEQARAALSPKSEKQDD